MIDDYYDILGVQQNAKINEIKSKYMSLLADPNMLKYSNAEKDKLALAFNTLSDPIKKREYDIELLNYIKEQSDEKLNKLKKHSEFNYKVELINLVHKMKLIIGIPNLIVGGFFLILLIILYNPDQEEPAREKSHYDHCKGRIIKEVDSFYQQNNLQEFIPELTLYNILNPVETKIKLFCAEIEIDSLNYRQKVKIFAENEFDFFYHLKNNTGFSTFKNAFELFEHKDTLPHLNSFFESFRNLEELLFNTETAYDFHEFKIKLEQICDNLYSLKCD